MKHEKLADALSELEDRHIQEALAPRRRYGWWISAVAAILVLAIGLGLLLRPGTQPEPLLQTPTLPVATDPADTQTPTTPGILPAELLSGRYTVAVASYPKMAAYAEDNYENYIAWSADQKAMHNQPKGYADSLQACWDRLVPALLDGNDGENATCSPLNIYMALAMLAECTDGQSRQQILNLLNVKNIQASRLQANQVWKAHYNDDNLSKSVLGSSLWLDSAYTFNQATANLLANNYFASVFHGELGAPELSQELQAWLNTQTGGLLTEQVQNVRFDPMTVLALATTIDYQVQWRDFKFSESANTKGVFHGAKGDTTETFMHTQLSYGPYYWSEHFGAVSMPLEDGSQMWLILPDEGISPEEITGEVMAFLADPNKQDQKRLKVNLALPKFDVVSQRDIASTLQQLGITNVFQSGVADFSPILTEDDGGYVSAVNHATRVVANEEGITAAAFTVIMRCGSAIPPADEMDFVLDRPFLFYVESQDNLPLFAGIVNEP